MLPSSQLIFGESPHEAAQRILLEQLGLNDQKLEEPRIFSEVWGPRGHWDLEFLFLGERERPPTHPAWRELKLLDLASTKKEDIARSHEDILAHVGLWKTTK